MSHLAHLRYLLRRKALYFRLGKLVGVGLWERLTHDVYQFRPSFWRLGVQVFHLPDPEEWIKRRSNEIARWQRSIMIKPVSDEEIEARTLELAKDEHLAWSKQMEKRQDEYALMVQHTARHRWEFYILRDEEKTRRVPMPEPMLRAMAADWMTGSMMSGAPRDEMPRQVRMWFVKHVRDINISPDARKFVQSLLEKVK